MPTTDLSNFQERQPMFGDRPDVVQPEPIKAPPVLGSTIDMMIDAEIVGMVNSRIELCKQWRRTRRIIWDKCWTHMKARYDVTNKQAWQSTTFMPLTSKVVEVIVSNLHSALFGPEMPVEWQTKRQDMDGNIRSINEIIQTDFDKCSAKAEFTDFLRAMCVQGTAIGEVGYLKQEEVVMIKQRQQASPMDEMLKSLGVNTSEQFVPKLMLVKDYATIKNVDLYDIYPEPRVSEFSKDHWVIHKSKITNRELMIGKLDPDPYYKLDNVTDELLQGSGLARVDQDPEKQTRRFALNDYNLYTHFLDPDREHELSTFYGLIPMWYLKPELRRDPKRQYDAIPGCIKVVDGQYVIWKRISPFRDGEPPYFKGNYIRLPTEFYGIGVAELVIGLQIEKNEIRNSRMDNINIAMNKIIAVIKEKIPSDEWKRLVSEPGAIWMVKGVDDVRKAIQQIEFGDVTKDSWMASKEVDMEAQEVTAANKDTQAAAGTGDSPTTFRGQMMNIQQATGRWMLYARMFEWTGLVPCMKKFYQRIYQWKNIQDAQEILGGERAQKFQWIAPEDLEKFAKLVPLGVMTMENKGIKLAQMNQFVQTCAMMAGPMPPWFKGLEFARKDWVEMGNPEPDSVLFSDDEMKQYNDFKRQLAMSMPQMPGGMQSPQGGPPSGLVGPSGQPLPSSQGPQTGNRANSPTGAPVSGNVPGPLYGMPRPALPARGPGAAPIDGHGMPLS